MEQVRVYLHGVVRATGYWFWPVLVGGGSLLVSLPAWIDALPDNRGNEQTVLTLVWLANVAVLVVVLVRARRIARAHLRDRELDELLKD